MSEIETDKKLEKKERRKNRVEEIAKTFEWLITAFILAFVFRAFVMEAFRIPTGSMADTLMGAHYRLRCRQCGYGYDYGFISRFYKDRVPLEQVKVPWTRCPSCGFIDKSESLQLVSNGDRILVLKCIYQFAEPKRWDVVVFRNPTEPRISYIKRMIARPGETVEIIDGDIYIDGLIARKPAKVQQELWMPVYDNDYQPARPEEVSFNGHSWKNPFITAGTRWINDAVNPVLFHLESPAGQINSLVYNTQAGNDFRCTYAYNNIEEYRFMPVCSDLTAGYYILNRSDEWGAGVSLSKYQNTYRAWADFTGTMKIVQLTGPEETILATKEIKNLPSKGGFFIKFTNVDHQLIFECGSDKLVYDLGPQQDSLGERRINIEPKVEILGSGKLSITHVSIFKDIYYTNRSMDNSKLAKAAEGSPVKLEKDQYFVLGDNSPISEDSRWWADEGKGNNGIKYQRGIVPRDYLVGKAVFVYWSGGFRPSIGQNYFPFAIIPNIGRMRFIAGD